MCDVILLIFKTCVIWVNLSQLPIHVYIVQSPVTTFWRVFLHIFTTWACVNRCVQLETLPGKCWSVFSWACSTLQGTWQRLDISCLIYFVIGSVQNQCLFVAHWLLVSEPDCLQGRIGVSFVSSNWKACLISQLVFCFILWALLRSTNMKSSA